MPPPYEPTRTISSGPGAPDPTRDHFYGPTGDTADPSAFATGAPGPRPADPPPLSTERYIFSEPIARGGMGVVYGAADTVLGRDVAIKVLQDRFGSSSAAARRFVDEARITAQLQHPAIPPVHDLGTLADGRPFLAMKLIKGQTLDAQLDARPDTGHQRGHFVAAFEQVCQALAYAHAHNVIHRDLKPANVMVGKFGEVQVMDWGLAKVLGARAAPDAAGGGTEVNSLRDSDAEFTQAGSVLGTPAFMPPEQAIGAIDQIDARSDVFGLGGILCAILTGRAPFVGATAENARQAAAKGQVADAFARLDACGADPELVALCKQCLAPEKEHRPADAGEVARAVAELRAAADERARKAEVERVTSEARAVERRKRRRLTVAAAVGLVLAVVGGLSAVLVVQRRAYAELGTKNDELVEERAKVEERFELALDAIKTFHTGDNEEWMLKDERFKPLRDRRLKSAADFYRKLGGMLGAETTFASRRALAQSNFELAELTRTVGRPADALAAHRAVLAAREGLAAEPGADPTIQIDLARSLIEVASLLRTNDRTDEALTTYRRAEQVLVGPARTDPKARAALAGCRSRMGLLLFHENKCDDALTATRLARADQEPLASTPDASPDARRDLAETVNQIGFLLWNSGKLTEAEFEFRTALVIFTKLAEEDPESSEFGRGQGACHFYIANALWDQGKPSEAEPEFRSAIAHHEKALTVNGAVTRIRRSVALDRYYLGIMLSVNGRSEDALVEYNASVELAESLIADNGPVGDFRSIVAAVRSRRGVLLLHMGKAQEAEKECRAADAIFQELEKEQRAQSTYVLKHALALNNLGSVFHAAGRSGEAKDRYEQAIRLADPLLQKSPKNSILHLVLVGSLRGYGLTLRDHQEFARAAAELRRALVICDDLTKIPECLYEMACCHAALVGLAGRPGSGVSAEDGPAEAEAAMKWLSRAVASGFRNRNQIRMDPAFVPLRERPAFRALLARIEPNARGGSEPKP